jgi:DNA-binding IclR family transcriptional regulator
MLAIQGSKPNNLVQTIARTSLILDILRQSPKGISSQDLSEKIKLPKGTTRRLISSLAYFGYARQDSKTRLLSTTKRVEPLLRSVFLD